MANMKVSAVVNCGHHPHLLPVAMPLDARTQLQVYPKPAQFSSFLLLQHNGTNFTLEC